MTNIVICTIYVHCTLPGVYGTYNTFIYTSLLTERNLNWAVVNGVKARVRKAPRCIVMISEQYRPDSWIPTACTIAIPVDPGSDSCLSLSTRRIPFVVYNRIARDLPINKGYVVVEITWPRGVLCPGRGGIGDKWENWRSDCWLVVEQNMLWGRGGRATSVTGPKAITLH